MTVILIYLFVEFVDTTSVDRRWWRLYLFICLLSSLTRQVLIEGDDGYTYLFVCWVRWYDKCWSKVMTVILIYLFVEFVDTTSVDRRWWRLYLFICLLSSLTRQVLIVGDDGYTYLFVCWVRWHDKCWSKVMTVILIYLFVESVDTTSVDRRWWRFYLFICLLSSLIRQVLIVGDDGYTYLFVCWVRWHDKCWS